ncbi:glucose 1-dehydrogenase [Streptomyces sp. NPDC003247]|uniref:glucose 1-dehydrogenase n=1 Tax=Streptomyces sp. NPDC003247 TaxID=3364677 RepID=UPI00368E3053
MVLEGKVALVTGASRGIGRGIAERLGADGARVIVNYRSDAEAAAQVVSSVERAGGRATAVRADVSDPEELRGLFEMAERSYGGLDLLVGNVGVARFAPLADATDEDFELMFTTNTRATFMALREAARRLRDGGRIVVVSSGAAVTARPASGLYAASKAAGDLLVRTAAKELGPRGITVNSVLPGATRTDALEAGMTAERLEATRAQTPLGRLGEPADIAAVVAFLVSDAGGWITGQTIHAGGGLF